MSDVRDSLEDTFLEANEFSTQESEVVQRTRHLCCRGKHVPFSPCCCKKNPKLRLGYLLAEDERTGQIAEGQNLIRHNEWKKGSRKEIETGSLAELKKSRKPLAPNAPTMEELRKRAGIKTKPSTFAKISPIVQIKKWKNNKKMKAASRSNSICEHRSFGEMASSELHLELLHGVNVNIAKNNVNHVLNTLLYESRMNFSMAARSKMSLVARRMVSVESIRSWGSSVDEFQSSEAPSMPTLSVEGSERRKTRLSISFGKSVRSPSYSKLDLYSAMKQGLEKGWPETVTHISSWQVFSKLHTFSATMRKTADRWMVIFYTSSGELDEFSKFCCLLARILLQHHCVAYEERDIALENQPYQAELKQRLCGKEIFVPYLFVAGLSLGGCRVLYGIHKLNLMDTFFGKFMMAKDKYDAWMYDREYVTMVLHMAVPLQQFPTLRFVANGSHVHIDRMNSKEVEIAKDIVNKAKASWKVIEKEKYTSLNLYRFAILKSTIILAFQKMEVIFSRAMFPRARFSRIWSRMGDRHRSSSSVT